MYKTLYRFIATNAKFILAKEKASTLLDFPFTVLIALLGVCTSNS